MMMKAAGSSETTVRITPTLRSLRNFCFWEQATNRVLHVVCFVLGTSPEYEFYISTFRNTLHGQVRMKN